MIFQVVAHSGAGRVAAKNITVRAGAVEVGANCQSIKQRTKYRIKDGLITFTEKNCTSQYKNFGIKRSYTSFKHQYFPRIKHDNCIEKLSF